IFWSAPLLPHARNKVGITKSEMYLLLNFIVTALLTNKHTLPQGVQYRNAKLRLFTSATQVLRFY
ncbi:hypothetical protein V6O07_08295, partial [Arthrospira platensis SPKY2]